MELRKFLLILSMALVLLLATVVWFFPSDEDFRIDNSFWNGTAALNSGSAARPMESLSDLPSSPQDSTLILIPYLDFAPPELEQLNSFVRQGGTLILADDYGKGNQILEYLGIETRFSGQTLLDPLSNYKNERFPRIPHFKPSPLTDGIESLVFNHATSLINVEDQNALAFSSRFSFLDSNDNQTRDDGETTGPLPVISQHILDSGMIILISDPSIFINGMETIADNNNFTQNITKTTEHNLLIDQSHLPPSNLHQTKSFLVRVRDFFITPPGMLLLVILALAITLKPVWQKRGEASEEISSSLMDSSL